MQNKPSKLFEGENSSLKRTFEKCLGVDEISVSSQEITKDNWEEHLKFCVKHIKNDFFYWLYIKLTKV